MARVEGSEVIAPNWADNSVQSGEKLLDLFDRLDDSIKKTSATSAKFAQTQSGQTAESIKKVNQVYAEQSKRLKDSIAIDKEKARLTQIYQMLNDVGGEVEVFNAQNICAIPFILDLRKENEKAKQDMKEYPNLKGIAASDTHHRLDQVHTAGIYLPEDTTSLEALTHYLQKKNFERHEEYVGKFTFGIGHFFPFF